MYKVAILGCENSHANQFLNHVLVEKKCNDIEFVGVYSDDKEAAQKLHDEFGVYVADSCDEFVGKVDGIVITARHGDNHYKYAKPYMQSGIPMFIDKPITVSEEDAIALAKDIKDNNVKFCGGSMCVFFDGVLKAKEEITKNPEDKILSGLVRAPLNLNNEYGGFFFYSQHLVEMMTVLFGCYPKSLKAYKNDRIITVIVRYEDYDIIAEYTDFYWDYVVCVSTAKDFITSLPSSLQLALHLPRVLMTMTLEIPMDLLLCLRCLP